MYHYTVMKVLFLGEVVGRCGLTVLKNGLKPLREELGADFVIANCEGATGGFGLGFSHAQTIFSYGVNVITTGEKSFYKIDMVENIGHQNRILRPYNFPEQAPGRGFRYFNVNGQKVCVINTMGMCCFTNVHLNNPFMTIERLVEKAHEETPFVFVSFHAQATAEKQLMAYMLDGKASCVVGTHCKALTADADVSENGTATITDLGRCGSSNSVGGFEPSTEIRKYRTQLVLRSHEGWEDPEIQGALITFDDKTGKAVAIETIRRSVEALPGPRPEERKK